MYLFFDIQIIIVYYVNWQQTNTAHTTNTTTQKIYRNMKLKQVTKHTAIYESTHAAQ